MVVISRKARNNCDTNVCILRSTAINPEPRVEKIAKWLQEVGFSVTVLGWDREGTSNPKDIINGIVIKRCRFKGQYGGALKNLFGFVQFSVYILGNLFRSNPQFVHACDFDTIFPALIYCTLTKKKIVYDIFDFYSESRRVGKLKGTITYLEKWACTKCDRIIIVHEKRIEQLEPISKSLRKKVDVIYNTPEEISVKHSDLDYRYFCYVGVLHPDRGIKNAMKAITGIPSIKLIYAGYGPLEEELKKLSLNAPNIKFIGRIDYDATLQLEGEALAIIAFYDSRSSGNNLYAAPNKLFEACMLAKPIITSTGTLLADIVETNDIGYVVPFGDDDSLRKIFLHIVDNPLEAKEKGKRARNLYDSKYSAVIAKTRLLGIYNHLVTDNGNG